MRIIRAIKWFFKAWSEHAQTWHEMEMGRLTCPKCKNRSMHVEERGVMPVGVCRNCKFEM